MPKSSISAVVSFFQSFREPTFKQMSAVLCKMTNMKLLQLSMLLLLAGLLLHSCQGQLPDDDKCRENYKQAKNAYAAYFINNDETALGKVLPNLDQAILCDKRLLF